MKEQFQPFKWKGTPLGLKAKMMFGAAGRSVGREVSLLTISALNAELFQILQSVKQMVVVFHHNIISTAWGVHHESDMIVDAYKDLIGTDAEENFDVPRELYSVDIFVRNAKTLCQKQREPSKIFGND